MINILKLNDIIALDNCLFIHDFLNNKLSFCFNSYFQSISDILSIITKRSELGCIHIPFFASMGLILSLVNVLIVGISLQKIQLQSIYIDTGVSPRL